MAINKLSYQFDYCLCHFCTQLDMHAVPMQICGCQDVYYINVAQCLTSIYNYKQQLLYVVISGNTKQNRTSLKILAEVKDVGNSLTASHKHA